MAGEDWNGVASEVADAIADVGVPMTLLRRGSGGPTSPHDTAPAPADVQHTIYAVPDMERTRDNGGTLIGVTRETLLVSAIGVVPQKDDIVSVRGTQRTVDAVDKLWQGGVDLLYTLTLVK